MISLHCADLWILAFSSLQKKKKKIVNEVLDLATCTLVKVLVEDCWYKLLQAGSHLSNLSWIPGFNQQRNNLNLHPTRENQTMIKKIPYSVGTSHIVGLILSFHLYLSSMMLIIVRLPSSFHTFSLYRTSCINDPTLKPHRQQLYHQFQENL